MAGVGIGVGIAAAIKLTPAIFIVFFLLARRTKAAFIAAGMFIGCGLIGFGSRPPRLDAVLGTPVP